MNPIGNHSASDTASSPGYKPDASRQVRVVAPSRLHFGLLSFGRDDGRQYGGIGLMIDQPAVQLLLNRAECFQIRFGTMDEFTPQAEAGTFRPSLSVRGCGKIGTGTFATADSPGFSPFRLGASPILPQPVRVGDFASRWAVFHGLPDPPPCCITLEATPPQHVGLGTGTQLALSVAAGLNALFGLGEPAAVELAMSVGRGLRSAVGTYGFVQGGLIVERGKLPGEAIAPLDCRLDLPADWRVVLVQPAAGSGLSGAAEQQAFDNLPPVPLPVTRQLADEIRMVTLPAAARGDFDQFSESVYRYGRLAGQCFAAIQGGPYNGPCLERLVESIRALGIRGVGQSSWGPTLFALLPDETAAERFQRQLSEELPPPLPVMLTTTLNRCGAQVTVQTG
jgi:beta-ribofuranosylaminobenzene 5'-phosphate synthase